MSCRYFTASHETLLWARKDPKGKHTFNYDAMKNGDWGDDAIKKPNKQMNWISEHLYLVIIILTNS